MLHRFTPTLRHLLRPTTRSTLTSSFSFFNTTNFSTTKHPSEPAAANDWIGNADLGKALIFGKTTCGFSTAAQNVMQDIGVNYTNVDLDKRSDGAAIQAELGSLTGQRTVPSVWINGTFIGGYSELTALPQNELFDMLNEAGAIKD